ncbi:hypothetical protein [Streptomyces sp. NPDC090080]|uniref:hypothetical protein n=1 Tax=Streptomyces sp. NPDC090080 TaxID=3365939 RepID=UPI0037FBC1DD
MFIFHTFSLMKSHGYSNPTAISRGLLFNCSLADVVSTAFEQGAQAVEFAADLCAMERVSGVIERVSGRELTRAILRPLTERLG